MATSSGTASGVGSFVPAPEEREEPTPAHVRRVGDAVIGEYSWQDDLRPAVSNLPYVVILHETGSSADGDQETVILCGETVVRFGDDVVDNYSDIATRFERSAAEHRAIAQWAHKEC